jgi:hypothetical protein
MGEPGDTYPIAAFDALVAQAMAEGRPIVFTAEGALRYVAVPPDYRRWPVAKCVGLDLAPGAAGAVVTVLPPT